MDDGRYRVVRVVEPGDDAPACVDGQLEALAVDVDVVPALLVPVRDFGGLVAERLPQSVLHLARARALGDRAEDGVQPGASRDRRAEQSREEEERYRRERHDERDAHQGATEAGERRHDEADRQQNDTDAGGEVDGPQDAAECRRCISPAADEKRESGDEQENSGRGPQHRLRDVRGVVVRDEDEVVRAGVRLARVPRGEHGIQQRRDESRRVAGNHEHTCLAADQLAARIRE